MTFALRRISFALAACGLAASTLLVADRESVGKTDLAYDPLLGEPGRVCGPLDGQLALLKVLIAAKTETAPFTPAPMKAAGGDVPLYANLGALTFKTSTTNTKAQAYFDQGLRLAFGFNHAEAQRSFQAAQRLDPACAMCWWGEALVLGPNINAPMMPEANAPALAALARAVALAEKGAPKERALIDALATRYSDDPKAERGALDAAYADAMKAVAERHAGDDTIQTLYAESAMDTQPWDYWQAAGTQPKGRGAEIVRALETVLARNRNHPGAIHLYIHAIEASTQPEKALPYVARLPKLMPGAGHMVHMPGHIYYRVGMFRESLEINKQAIAADERYFGSSPSDPFYKSAYYPHNIHFLMVSAQMGGDAKTAIDAAAKLDANLPVEVVRQVAALEPIKAAPYTTQALLGTPEAVLALPAPDDALLLVRALRHYARAVAYAGKKEAQGAQREIDAIATIEAAADFKPYEAWAVPAREIMAVAKLVARARLADAQGELADAAKHYTDAIAIEGKLAYTEPPYWYYPVRQSLGSVLLRQGKLEEAEQAFRDSLGRVRNNGWALAGLAEVYRQKGDANAERTVRKAYARAWFGARGGPEMARL